MTCAYFKLNRNFISQTLCENRDNPEMKCNGVCYLTKVFTENENQKEQAPELTKEETTNVVFLLIKKNLLKIETTLVEETKLFSVVSNLYFFSYLKEVFHPPQIG